MGAAIVIGVVAVLAVQELFGGDDAATGAELAESVAVSVVQGRLVLGDAEAGDVALVSLVAWPPSEDLAEMEEGDEVELGDVATAEVDANGRFVLEIDDPMVLEEFVGRSGGVDLEVQAVYGSHTYSRSFTLTPAQVVEAHQGTLVVKLGKLKVRE